MDAVPKTPELVDLIRNADLQDIRRRLDELNGEEAALRSLLRSIQARERARQITGKAEGHER